MKPITAHDLLAEADLCAQHAQEAASCGRLCAACGLILTADALCERALGERALDSTGICPREELEREILRRRGFYQDEIERLLGKAVETRLRPAL